MNLVMDFAIPDSIPRAALVTGGDTAAGAAIAGALAAAGFAVALLCPSDTAEGQAQVGFVLRADLGDEAATEAVIGRASGAIGPLGVLVNAASEPARDSWEDTTRHAWNRHCETGLRAPFILTRHFASALPEAREGVVINLLDPRVDPNALSRTQASAALWAQTRSLALALAPRIRVNAVRDAGGAEEIARAVLAILALPSMTGQMMVPGGLRPPARQSEVPA